MQVSLWCFLFAPGLQATAQQPATSKMIGGRVILGVLEDIPGEYTGESDFRAVRAVFEKNGDGWQAFPPQTKSYPEPLTPPSSYPKEMTWTIAFDGRNLGTITALTPPQYHFYSEIGIENIISHGPVPTIGKKLADFAGFSGAPVYRPLVAVSQPNFTDPDQWKPTQLAPELIATARQQFRSKFPKVSNCKEPNETLHKPWDYRDEDIKVSKSYSSNNEWALIELQLTGYACDGMLDDDSAFGGQWYVIDPTGKPRFLGTNIWLVDAGDYDNSGSSEVLFSINGYNSGGYRLFYKNFTQSAEFLFHYH